MIAGAGFLLAIFAPIGFGFTLPAAEPADDAGVSARP